MGGLTIIDSNTQSSHYHNHKGFLFRNYFFLGAASSCIFFTLSFHLSPAASSSSSCTSSPSPVPSLDAPPPPLSPVAEEDGSVILKLAGGLCVLIFCLECVVLTLAFFLKYYANVDGGDNSMKRSAKVQQMEDEDIPNPPRSHHIRCRLWMHLLLHFLRVLVRRPHGGHSFKFNFSRLCFCPDFHENRGFSGEFEILCERRRWVYDTEIGWRVVCVDLLFGVGCAYTCFFTQVLCECGWWG
ncbi:hypothetical protein Acr_07g0015940 [Actinidia rufa]|uniref:Uncharacterized protein n=1 Tax=Actinidia rufa TaxID=165716 RepID=A0A7J0EYA4_9ERIC|nr:hypothetical protein Acr_07g0015940 [Actinidia rufa]